jgi:hypothetical protein
VPEKDKVQDAVSLMKVLQLETSNGKDTTLNFPVWNSSTKEAMLMQGCWMQSRSVVTLRPTKKPRHSMWRRKKR